MGRGSLLPLGCEATAKPERAPPTVLIRPEEIGAASRPSGSKLPRHEGLPTHFALRPVRTHSPCAPCPAILVGFS
ncbi:hypothetical protein EJA72_22635 [Pseudomonas sp. PB120]|nr:hypothetical protein [Pseudomonas sp. PB120]